MEKLRPRDRKGLAKVHSERMNGRKVGPELRPPNAQYLISFSPSEKEKRGEIEKKGERWKDRKNF